MSQPVTPLNELAGAPGNLQDVADLQQMLAQSQAELREAEMRIAHLKKSVETLTDQRDNAFSTADRLRERISEQTEEIEGLKDDICELKLDSDDARSLATARRLIKGGATNDGLHEIERVLDRSFDSWRIYA